jgi:hypothetical protein
MIERIACRGMEFEVDRDRTTQFYEELILDSCQCDFCENARITRRYFMSKEQIELLRCLGLSPLRPALSSHTQSSRKLPPEFTRRITCWVVFGKIIGDVPTSIISTGLMGQIWADTSPEACRAFDSQIDRYDLSGAFYVFCTNVHPWLPGQLTAFRVDVREPCSECGRVHRRLGYLTRRSLIPQWYALPHLREVLHEGKQRVRIEFCTNCGHMDPVIVPRKRPFYTNEHLKKELQRWKQARAELLSQIELADLSRRET